MPPANVEMCWRGISYHLAVGMPAQGEVVEAYKTAAPAGQWLLPHCSSQQRLTVIRRIIAAGQQHQAEAQPDAELVRQRCLSPGGSPLADTSMTVKRHHASSASVCSLRYRYKRSSSTSRQYQMSRQLNLPSLAPPSPSPDVRGVINGSAGSKQGQNNQQPTLLQLTMIFRTALSSGHFTTCFVGR